MVPEGIASVAGPSKGYVSVSSASSSANPNSFLKYSPYSKAYSRERKVSRMEPVSKQLNFSVQGHYHTRTISLVFLSGATHHLFHWLVNGEMATARAFALMALYLRWLLSGYPSFVVLMVTSVIVQWWRLHFR